MIQSTQQKQLESFLTYTCGYLEQLGICDKSTQRDLILTIIFFGYLKGTIGKTLSGYQLKEDQNINKGFIAFFISLVSRFESSATLFGNKGSGHFEGQDIVEFNSNPKLASKIYKDLTRLLVDGNDKISLYKLAHFVRIFELKASRDPSHANTEIALSNSDQGPKEVTLRFNQLASSLLDFLQNILGDSNNGFSRYLHALVSIFQSCEKELHDVCSAHSGLIKTPASLYSFVINYFANSLERKDSSFSTPDEVARLIVQLAAPGDGDSVYDPVCGLGGLLAAASGFVHGKHGSDAVCVLHGQDVDPSYCALADMHLCLNDDRMFQIECGDTILSPKFVNEEIVKQFDVVVANPPLITKDWGADLSINDMFGRFEYGVPPRNRGDYAFIQHMLMCLKPDQGRLVTVAPHGVLFRRGSEWDIRKKIVEANLLDAVVSLPDKLFHEYSISTVILVFKKGKKDNKILFIDGSKAYQEGKKYNRLTSECINKIVKSYNDREEVPFFSHLASIEDVAENDYNLTVPIYVSLDDLEQGNNLEMIVEQRAELKEIIVQSFSQTDDCISALQSLFAQKI